MSLSSFLYKGADQDLLKKDLTDVFGLTKTSAEVEKPYAELDAPEGMPIEQDSNEEEDNEEQSGSENEEDGEKKSRKRKAEADPEDIKSAKRRKKEKEKEKIKVNPDARNQY